jgi:uncharacterized protein (UPF0332 family)
MNPKEFLKIAEDLCNVGNPASLRTAISRSYYASFLTARDYAENTLGKAIRHDSRDHYLVKEYLKEIPDSEISELADDLGDLQDYRKRADYDMNDHTPEKLKKAEELFLMAENIIKKISEA